MQKVFLRWWLLIVLMIVGGVIANYFNAVEFLYNNDVTRLSFLIIAIFILTSSVVGYKILLTERGIKKYRIYEREWFAAEAMLSVGLLGTVIGFSIVLLGTFGDLDLSSSSSVQDAISMMSSGMGSAMTTTGTGLLLSILLKCQLILVDQNA